MTEYSALIILQFNEYISAQEKECEEKISVTKRYLGVAERHVEWGRKIHTNCRGVHVSARSDKRFDDIRMVLHSSTVERSKAICAIDEHNIFISL